MTNYFARQKLIPDFSQDKLTNSTCLLLGVGGLGTNVAIALTRLGVGKIIMIDYDVVDDHNLNRQVLFAKKHVGKSKVHSAAEVLREHHNLVTEIVAIEINVLTNWNVVVEQAKQSTIIFNMIDVGDYFDYAVQSLALSLGIPLCQGGTFQYTLTIDFIAKNGAPCIACLNDSYPETEVTDKLKPTLIQALTDISFVPRNDNPVGQSTFLVANQCANMMVACFLNDLQGISKPAARTIFYLSDFQSLNWEIEAKSNCLCTKSGENIGER